MKNILIGLFVFSLNISFSQIETFKLNETRTYEVTATLLPNYTIISIWMEALPNREISSQAGEMQVAYKFSTDLGDTWSNKKVLDNLGTSLSANPYLTTDDKGNTYLILMRINNDFFSGNLSFYEWNKKLNEFELKSIPVSSDSTLLDKPALAVSNGNIYLTYMEYTKKLENSYLKIHYSTDQGKTWSKSRKVTNDKIIYLGPSLKSLNENLFLSYGTYWNQKIHFTKAAIDKNGAVSFQETQTIANVSDILGSAMTELAVNKKGHLAVGWLYNHKPNEIYVSVSKDKGENWKKPLLLSKKGNLLSITFDSSGNLLCLYDEFKNDCFSVVFEKIPTSHPKKQTKKIYIKSPTAIIGKRDYIGAFQKIIHTKNKINLAFWIDYSKNNKLFFSKWRDK